MLHVVLAANLKKRIEREYHNIDVRVRLNFGISKRELKVTFCLVFMSHSHITRISKRELKADAGPAGSPPTGW